MGDVYFRHKRIHEKNTGQENANIKSNNKKHRSRVYGTMRSTLWVLSSHHCNFPVCISSPHSSCALDNLHIYQSIKSCDSNPSIHPTINSTYLLGNYNFSLPFAHLYKHDSSRFLRESSILLSPCFA